MRSKRRVLLYDFFVVKGGAEYVCMDIFNNVEDIDLSVAFANNQLFPSFKEANKRVRTLADYTSVPGWQLLKAALLFRFCSKWLSQYDTVIFSGTSAPLSFKKAKNDARKVMYCHTPPRFIYDLKPFYLAGANKIEKILILALIKYLQPRYEEAIKNMDVVIANSRNVQERLKRFLNVESQVIYPPCNIEQYKWLAVDDYYLSVARIEPYKRVELIVKAFIKTPEKKLVVASHGSDFFKLKELAKGCTNITFTGWCSDEELGKLIGRCIATIYIPIDEDFGMSPVESMSAGKPVIGVDEGGVKETVLHKRTGYLCPENPSEDDIISACQFISSTVSLEMKNDCIIQAKNFSRDRFFTEMKKFL